MKEEISKNTYSHSVSISHIRMYNFNDDHWVLLNDNEYIYAKNTLNISLDILLSIDDCNTVVKRPYGMYVYVDMIITKDPQKIYLLPITFDDMPDLDKAIICNKINMNNIIHLYLTDLLMNVMDDFSQYEVISCSEDGDDSGEWRRIKEKLDKFSPGCSDNSCLMLRSFHIPENIEEADVEDGIDMEDEIDMTSTLDKRKISQIDSLFMFNDVKDSAAFMKEPYTIVGFHAGSDVSCMNILENNFAQFYFVREVEHEVLKSTKDYNCVYVNYSGRIEGYMDKGEYKIRLSHVEPRDIRAYFNLDRDSVIKEVNFIKTIVSMWGISDVEFTSYVQELCDQDDILEEENNIEDDEDVIKKENVTNALNGINIEI